MPLEIQQGPIRFNYPDNWSATQDDDPSWPLSVSVHSPTGAFLTVTVDLADGTLTAEQVVEAMREQYDELEALPTSVVVGDTELLGLELNFYCLDLLITAHVLEVDLEDHLMVVMYQAESREFAQLFDVFRAMIASMLS